MIRKAKLIVLPLLIIGFTSIGAEAYYIQQQDNNYEENSNVDVFKPTSGAQVKASPLAQMMENATKNATQRKNQQKQNNTNKKQNNQSNWF